MQLWFRMSVVFLSAKPRAALADIRLERVALKVTQRPQRALRD
jgi:hypothetical protein